MESSDPKVRKCFINHWATWRGGFRASSSEEARLSSGASATQAQPCASNTCRIPPWLLPNAVLSLPTEARAKENPKPISNNNTAYKKGWDMQKMFYNQNSFQTEGFLAAFGEISENSEIPFQANVYWCACSCDILVFLHHIIRRQKE